MDVSQSHIQHHSAEWHPEVDVTERPVTGSSTDMAEQLSVHVRSRSTAYAPSPKRLSVFSGRSRSNTSASTTSSRSPASSMTSTDVSSLDDRVSTAMGFRTEKQESKTRSLLSRGSRILRRQGSKFTMVATLNEEEDEADRDRDRDRDSKAKFEVADLFGRGHKSRQSSTGESLSESTPSTGSLLGGRTRTDSVASPARPDKQRRRLISDPFDFHHVTHTQPSQFQSLSTVRQTDLVTEFSAIRASQRAQLGLKGIRAENIHFRNFSSENVGPDGVSIPEEETESLSHIASPRSCASPDSSVVPASTADSATPYPTSRLSRAVSQTRSYENFSRPGARLSTRAVPAPATTPTSAIASPPMRVLPRLPSSPDLCEPSPRAIDEILGLNGPRTFPENLFPSADDRGSSVPCIQGLGIVSTEWAAGSRLSAVRSSSIYSQSLDLEEVPEDDELVSWWNEISSPTTDRRSAAFSSPQAVTQLSVAELPTPDVDTEDDELSKFVEDQLAEEFAMALPSPTVLDPPVSQEDSLADDEQVAEPELKSELAPEPVAVHVDPLPSSPQPVVAEQETEDLASPTLPHHHPSQMQYPSIHEQVSAESTGGVEMEADVFESWDDCIDYCYEHAAESNSDFDWLRSSFEGQQRPTLSDLRARSGIINIPTIKSSLPKRSSPRSKQRQKRLTSSSLRTSVSESTRGSLSLTRIVESHSAAAEQPYHHRVISPPTCRSLDQAYFQTDHFGKPLSQDALYEEYLTADGSSDRHFPFGPQNASSIGPGAVQSSDQSTSPRNSFSPISKCNSQESLMLSRAASIVRKHRSSISANSVPELIHSTTHSREYTSMPEYLAYAEQAQTQTGTATATATAVSTSSPSSTNAGRLDPPQHRQKKSLASELEKSISSRNGNNVSVEVLPAYDGSRSASDTFDGRGVGAGVGAGVSDRAMESSETPPPVPPKSSQTPPPVPPKSSFRRSGRKSYSLFPVAGAAI